MTMIVETGLGVTDSNAYVSLTYAQNYHELYGNLDWVGTTPELELALINATRSLDTLYGTYYLSYPIARAQSLLFPRISFYTQTHQLVLSNTLPVQLKQATCELALSILLGQELFPLVDNSSQIKQLQVKVGDIETNTAYFGKATGPKYQGLDKVEMILKPILMVDAQSSINIRL